MKEQDELFYDGGCALCHRTVSFLLNRGKKGETFRFAPLAGVTFKERLTPEQRAGLPDSVVILRASGEVLWRSGAYLTGEPYETYPLRRFSHTGQGHL